MEKLLLITPPFVQVNCPYPATAYLKGYLTRQGYQAEQYDLSIELINRLFSRDILLRIFDACTPEQMGKDPNLERMYGLRERYLSTIDTVMEFLRKGDNTLATLICNGEFLPQAERFDAAGELDYFFGNLGTADCAKFLCTLYLQDLSDLIRGTVTEHFEIVRYGERISMSIPLFAKLEAELRQPRNPIEEEMVALLERQIEAVRPTLVGFTAPFPGNLLAILRCAQYLKERHPDIRIAMGGGYPSTELRTMTDKPIFRYIAYIILDDGERPLERLFAGNDLLRTYARDGYHEGEAAPLTHAERGCPDFSGLPHDKYLSLTEVTNPMHRLWSDGRWNKMMLAHGCYWAKCAFCDTALDYICRYESVPAAQLVDWMEQVMGHTGSRCFHFVDEAASPTMLRELSLEILRRGLKVAWWTNIRFEKNFTGDLAQLMSAAGCIAVSGGLEVASDRLLALMDKGVTIEQATLAMRNFFYAGIMVHTYLMYGFPTQTLQESVDALEVVRQLFRAELIGSAFWHRYAMTVHSPSGIDPEKYGVHRKNKGPNGFANNEVPFTEIRTYNINTVGEALNEALTNYMCGGGIDRPAHKWFKGKEIPPTTLENTLITDQLIKPDASRIYNDPARLVWIGVPLIRTGEGVTARNNTGEKQFRFGEAEAEFLMELTLRCADLSRKVTLADAKQLYGKYSPEPFVVFYHSKQWDQLRKYGLLQI